MRALAGRGLEGDRYAVEAGKYSGRRLDDAQRAVSLIEREAIEGAGSEYGIELDEVGDAAATSWSRASRSTISSGRSSASAASACVASTSSEPCTYLEGLTRKGVRKSLVHRGGLRAEILDDGVIRVGDCVSRLRSDAEALGVERERTPPLGRVDAELARRRRARRRGGHAGARA